MGTQGAEICKMDRLELRYILECRNARIYRKDPQVTIDVDSSSVSIVGDELSVKEKTQELTNLTRFLYVVTDVLSDVSHQCFGLVKSEEVAAKLRNFDLVAGWDTSYGQLQAISNTVNDAQIALKLIKEIIVESAYPFDEELSYSQTSLVEGTNWIDLTDRLKANDATKSLVIQYDQSARKIKFALKSSGNKETIIDALEIFFMQEHKCSLSHDDAQLVSKNEEYVSKFCAQDGVTYDFNQLSSCNCFTIKSKSMKLFDTAVHKLKSLIDRKNLTPTKFGKLCDVSWIESLIAQVKIDEISRLTHTVANIQTLLPWHHRLELIEDDISAIEADGLVSCSGAVALSIEHTYGFKPRSGLQLFDGTRALYHMYLPPQSTREGLLRVLHAEVKKAYLLLSENAQRVIAFPAIGTGGLGLSPERAASTIVGTVVEYLNDSSEQKILFVIHPDANRATYNAFDNELQKHKSQAGAVGASHAKQVTFTGFHKGNVREAVERLEKEIRQSMVKQTWNHTSEQFQIQKLTSDEVSKIYLKAKEANVDANVDVEKGAIEIEGLKENVHTVQEYVDNILRRKPQTNAFPSYWSQAAMARGNHEVKLHYDSMEFNRVKDDFVSTCGNRAPQVTEIIRIQNETLYTQYQAQKSKVDKEVARDGSIKVERELWHGTTAESVKQICTNGFNRSIAGKNGSQYGVGSYFSTTIQYSGGQQQIILAKVATGRYEPGKPNTKNLRTGYHSTVDDTRMPTIFVVYHDAAAYPEYVIKFQ